MADRAKGHVAKKARAHAAVMEAELSATFRRLRTTPEAIESLRRMLRQKAPEFDASWSDERVYAETERRLSRGQLGMRLRRRSRESYEIALQPIKEELEPKRRPPPVREPVDQHWIEIQLLGEDDKPIPNARYRIALPDGSERTGSLDGGGIARVDGIEDAGSCTISFPDLDRDAWEPIG